MGFSSARVLNISGDPHHRYASCPSFAAESSRDGSDTSKSIVAVSLPRFHEHLALNRQGLPSLADWFSSSACRSSPT